MPLTALLGPGDEVLTTDALYGPTRRFLNRHLKARGVAVNLEEITEDLRRRDERDSSRAEIVVNSPSNLKLATIR